MADTVAKTPHLAEQPALESLGTDAATRRYLAAMLRDLNRNSAVNVQTLSGTLTLLKTSAAIQKIDPAGNRKILLPKVAAGDRCHFLISNAADAAETITVRNYADGSTFGTIGQSEESLFVVNDAGTWVQVSKVTVTAV